MQLWTLTVLLGAGAAAIPDFDVPDVTITTGGIYDAPEVSPFPWWDLPPSDDRDGGVWLPMRLHLAMTRWWHVYADDVPVLVQYQLDQAADVAAAEWEQALELGAARERYRNAKAAIESGEFTDTGMQSWIRTTIYVVVGGVLLVIGGLAGWGLSRISGS